MRSTFLLAAAAMICVAGGPVLAQSDPDVIQFSKETGGNRTAGWTRSAMEAAKQAELPNVNPDAVRTAVRRLRAARPAGEPGGTTEEDLAPAGGERMSGNVKNKPLYWAGKLFFTKTDGDYVCSAQFISKNVVLTAAHCVRDSDTGDWHTNFAFALQYENGKYSHVYGARCFSTLAGWVSQDDSHWTYDFATILVDSPSETGYFGTRWNWAGDYDSLSKIGYPTSMEDGEVIQVEHGPVTIQDGIVEMHHGNMKNQGGSSGGAWIGGYNDGSGDDGNRVVSVQSFSYEGVEGYGYGPYLSDSFRKLWQFTENDCK
jgi:Trypsin